MTRERVRLIAVIAATALGVVATAISLLQDDEPPSPATTAPGTFTAPPVTTAPAPVPPPVADRDDVPRARADPSPPPRGTLSSRPAGAQREVSVRRPDGTAIATARPESRAPPSTPASRSPVRVRGRVSA